MIPTPAIADVPPAELVESSLADYAIDSCKAETVEVRWLGLAEERLPTAIQDIVWDGDPCRRRPDLRMTVVDAGKIDAQYTLRPSLVVSVRVPVANADFRPGDPVTANWGLVPIEKVQGTPITSGNWAARVNIDAGEPITDAVVEQPIDAKKGSAVTLQIVRGALTLNAPGSLLEDARIGESIRVVNEATHVALRGVLVAPDTVQLQ